MRHEAGVSTPLRLYKYCSSSAAKKIIEGQSLRFSPISAFNDPFDCLAGTSHLKNKQFMHERMAGLIQNKTLPTNYPWSAFVDGYQQTLPALEKGLFESSAEARGIFRILCFSMIPPNDPRALLLWSHYAKETDKSSHDGVVLEFDGEHEWVGNHRTGRQHRDDPIIDAGPVRYPESLQRPSPPPDNEGRFHINDEIVFTKSSHWAYEAEYRLLREARDPTLRREPVDSLLGFPRNLLVSITFGLNTGDETTAGLVEAGRRFPQVRFHKAARIHPEKYQLIIEDFVPGRSTVAPP